MHLPMAWLGTVPITALSGSCDLAHISQHSSLLTAAARLSFVFMTFLLPLGKLWVKQVHLSVFSSSSTIPPKHKAKKANKNGKSVSKKRQQPPVHLTTEEETWTTVHEEDPSLKAVMTLLGIMSIRTRAYEERHGEVTSETTAHAAFFTAPTAPSTSRALGEGTTQRPTIVCILVWLPGCGRRSEDQGCQLGCPCSPVPYR